MSQSKINAIILAVALTLVVMVAWTLFYTNAQKNAQKISTNDILNQITPSTPTPSPEPTPNPEPNPIPNPVPMPGNVFKGVGQREGAFLIAKINTDNVEGIWYDMTPVSYQNPKGVNKVLRVGDDVGYACLGISEKITGIDVNIGKVGFNKVVGAPAWGGCPR